MYLKTSHSSCLYENQKYRKATGKFHLLFSSNVTLSVGIYEVFCVNVRIFCKRMFLHKAKANPDKWHAMYFSFTIGLESALPLFYETQLYKKGRRWSDLASGSFKHHLNSPVSINNTIQAGEGTIDSKWYKENRHQLKHKQQTKEGTLKPYHNHSNATFVCQSRKLNSVKAIHLEIRTIMCHVP